MKKDILPREYPELDPDDLRIVLVEGSDKLLGSMDPRAGQRALDDLRHLMVEVRLGCVMKGYKDKIVTFADGTEEYWETLIWTAGVRGETIPGLPPEYVSRAGRIPVDPYCRVKGLDDVYAIGDIALLECEDYPKGHPQVAQVAIQMARNLALTLNGTKQPVPFRYNDKGSMATIGKNRAVVDMKGRFISGRIAWLAWMFIHLISILGMRNKLSVLLNWCWNYVTYSTSLRLLFRPAKYPLRKHWGD